VLPPEFLPPLTQGQAWVAFVVSSLVCAWCFWRFARAVRDDVLARRAVDADPAPPAGVWPPRDVLADHTRTQGVVREPSYGATRDTDSAS